MRAEGTEIDHPWREIVATHVRDFTGHRGDVMLVTLTP